MVRSLSGCSERWPFYHGGQTWLVTDDGKPTVPAASADVQASQHNCYIVELRLLGDTSG